MTVRRFGRSRPLPSFVSNLRAFVARHFRSIPVGLTLRKSAQSTAVHYMNRPQHSIRYAFLVIAVSVLAGCATSTKLPTVETQAAAIPIEERRAGFDKFWNAINDNFYDPSIRGLDWPAVRAQYLPQIESAATPDAYYAVMSKFAAEVGDSHVYVRAPVETYDRLSDSVTGVGMSMRFIGKELVVSGIRKDGPAERAGLKRGMVIESIDAKAASIIYADALAKTPPNAHPAYFSRLVSRLTRPPVGTEVTIMVRNEQDAPKTIKVVSETKSVEPPTKVRVERLPSNVALIRMNQVGFAPILSFRQTIIDQKDAAGIIIDLRGNPGGAVAGVLGVVDPFLDSTEEIARVKMRPMNPLLSVLSFGNTDTSSPLATGRLFEREYAGPLAVLVDENTASAAEMIAASLQDYVGAIVVGRPSCGCVTGLFGFTSLPGGGEFAVSRMQIFLTKRGSIERKGVKPDIEVPLTLADLQNSSNDRTLLAAETALLKGSNATPAKVSAIQ